MSGASGASGASTKKDSSSSSNSVISSSSSEEGEDYDSGAFSRTSTPEAHNNTARISALLNTSTMSISRLPPTEPLNAPSLVLAACLEYGVPLCDIANDSVDASFVLSCLNAASRSSAFEDSQTTSRSRKASTSDVSVTIGANSKLTICPDFEEGGPVRRSGQLRRSR